MALVAHIVQPQQQPTKNKVKVIVKQNIIIQKTVKRLYVHSSRTVVLVQLPKSLFGCKFAKRAFSMEMDSLHSNSLAFIKSELLDNIG